jgi:uncharacterized membrane protein YgdD (TMEM256/DUF423 family)
MDLSARILLVLAALSGMGGVMGGAFGAHAAGSAEARAWMQTGGHYQLIHALAVFAAFGVWRMGGGAAPLAAGWLFLAGSLVFAGSLYAMAMGAPRWLGAVTPVGGALLILGWAALAWAGATAARSELI